MPERDSRYPGDRGGPVHIWFQCKEPKWSISIHGWELWNICILIQLKVPLNHSIFGIFFFFNLKHLDVCPRNVTVLFFCFVLFCCCFFLFVVFFIWITSGHDLDLPHSAAAKLVSTLEALIKNLANSCEEETLQSPIMKYTQWGPKVWDHTT